VRDKFRGYYRPTQAEENDMWSSADIVMDTNVVLDLYKYHAKTTDLYLRSLDKFKAQLWLPYQVALEFHKNRPKVRAETTKGHKDRIKDLEGIKNKIQQSTPKSKLASSKVELELIAKTDEAIAALRLELKQLTAETHVNSPDKVLDRITELFEGRVGEAPTDSRLAELQKEAEQRFDKSIPPGYEDRKTKAAGEEYGDFLLWRQVMDYAKEKGKNIIIATEDKKADWWQKLNGEDIVGPRPELIQEFRAETGQEIIFYSGRDFFQQLSDRAKIAESREDLAGALADVTSVSDERSAAQAAAAETLDFTFFKARDLPVERSSDKSWNYLVSGHRAADLRGQELRRHVGEMRREAENIEMRLDAALKAFTDADDDSTRDEIVRQIKDLHNRSMSLRAIIEETERQVRGIDARIDRDTLNRAWRDYLTSGPETEDDEGSVE